MRGLGAIALRRARLQWCFSRWPRHNSENAKSRIDGLRAALAVLGLLSAVAFVAARRLPKVQPSDPKFADAVNASD